MVTSDIKTCHQIEKIKKNLLKNDTTLFKKYPQIDNFVADVTNMVT